MSLSPQEKDNLTRWEEPKKPFYEVYYLKLNDPEQEIAAWLRYTLLAPLTREPEASVWGVFFDAADPKNNFGLKKTFSIREARIEQEIFYFAAGPSAIYENGARGELSDEKRNISWELKFQEESLSLRHLPFPLYFGKLPKFPKTKLLAPHLSTGVSGELIVNHRKFLLENVPAHQAHLWGTRMASSWVWGNCNAFHEDPTFCFEGLTVPPFTLLFFFWEGKLFQFNSPIQWFTNRSKSTLDRWHFEAGTRDLRFVGDLFSDPEAMVGVRYEDPDGSSRFCHNTKVANLKIQILRKRNQIWESVQTFTASKTAAYEMAGLNSDPRVRLMIS